MTYDINLQQILVIELKKKTIRLKSLKSIDRNLIHYKLTIIHSI